VPYLGIGAAAHSYDQRSRQWNTDDMDCYIQAIASGHTCEESEQMDQDTRYNDRLTTALRTREGLSLDCLTTAQRPYCLFQAKKLIDGGLLINEADRLRLSRSGLFVSDMVISSLMLV
jgi:oxygen-independent coproporphyrinogen-3 oxidase